jgi:hypothetical protein
MSQPLKRPFYNALENCPVVKDLEARDALLQALKEIEQPGWYFAALLTIARRDPEAVAITDLKTAYTQCAQNDDCSLALPKHLYRVGDHDDARAIVSGLAHIRFDVLQKGRALGFNDTTFTMDLSCLQELLAMPEGSVPIQAADDFVRFLGD